MRGIVRAAAYLPHASIDGRRVAGPDEDEFTMAASALERLAENAEEDPLPGRLLLAGRIPASAELNLARFLGTPVRAERFGAGDAGALAALRSALDAGGGSGPTLVVAVDLTLPDPDRGAVPASDAGLALEVGEGGLSAPAESDGSVPSESATRRLLDWARRSRGVDARTFTGDWFDDPAVGPPPREDRSSRLPLPGDAPVSQGAYIPHPRYVASVPSRWRLVAEHCSACAAVTFPARGRCRSCGRTDQLRASRLPLDGGTVVATTVIGAGGQPTEFDPQVSATGPYGVVLADLARGVRGTFQVADSADPHLAIGARIGTRLRRLYPMEGEWRYGRKAVLLPERAGA